MKVWQLIAELMKHPAGNDVNVALFASIEQIKKNNDWLATACSISINEDCSDISVIRVHKGEYEDCLETDSP